MVGQKILMGRGFLERCEGAAQFPVYQAINRQGPVYPLDFRAMLICVPPSNKYLLKYVPIPYTAKQGKSREKFFYTGNTEI